MRLITPPFLISTATGGGGDVSANVTGVSSTGSVGTVSTTYSGSVTVTGVSSTTGIGSVTVTTNINQTVNVTGVTSTGSVGTVTTTRSGSTTVTGVSSTTAVGTVTVDTAGNVNASVTGVSCTGSIGTVSLNYDYTYYVPVNLLTYSEDFTDSSWLVTRASKSTAATAPDGSNTAIKLIEDTTAANTHYIYKVNGSAIRSGYPITSSIYAKQGERSLLVLLVRDNSNVNGFGYEFNLNAGTVIERGLVGNGQYLGGSIEAVGDGWYRCIATGYLSSSDTDIRSWYLLEASTLTYNYNGDGTSGLYLWGGQLEQNAAASPYTKTTSTTTSFLYSSGSIGTLTFGIGKDVTVTGVNATCSVGTVTATAESLINVDVTGVSCTGATGTVTCNYDYAYTVTGVSVNGAVGSVTIGGTGLKIWTDVTQATTTWDDINLVNSTWTEV